MASNDNNEKCKVEQETDSLTARNRLRLSNDDSSDDDSSDFSDLSEEELPEEETEEEEEEEVSSEGTLMNKLEASDEKLFAMRACGMLFGDDGDTPSKLLEPRTPKSHWRSDEERNSDDDDDFWM
jgi:hypothetical protein